MWSESRLLGLAWYCAAALGLVTLAAWLVPASLAEDGLLWIGRGTLAELLPLLAQHRTLLLLVTVVAAIIAAAGTWLMWSASAQTGGMAVGICVAVELVILAATLPIAGIVLGLLLVNAAAWLALVAVGLYVVFRLLA